MKTKITAAIMSLAMITSTGAVFAEEPVLISSNETTVEDIVNTQKYIQYAITVKSATNEAVVAEIDGVETTFKITEDTLLISKTRDLPKEGDKFVVLVDALSPAPTVYPPVYTAAALVRTEGSVFCGKVVKADDEKLKAEDGSMEFVTGETGYAVEDLENKEVIIAYSQATYSLPAIAVADMIVVLDDTQEEVVEEEKEEITEEAQVQDFIVYNVEVTAVEGEKITGKYENGEASFITGENTLVISKTKDIVAVGEVLKVVIDAQSPMMPSEPAIYVPTAIVRGENNLYVGEFDIQDDVLVSEDNTLALNLEGTDFDKEKLDNNDLLVIYGASTRSIPALTTPEFIAVLKDNNASFAAALKDRAIEKNESCYKTIEVYVDQKPIDFSKYSNVLPIIEDDFTLVPIRAIAEALGCEVEYDDTKKLVTIKSEKVTIELTLNSSVAKVNGEEKTLSKEAKVIEGRTMVPARFVSENMGHKVDWDQDSLSVIID